MRETRGTIRSSALVAGGVFVWTISVAIGISPRDSLAQYPNIAVVHADPVTFTPTSYGARADIAQQFYAAHADAYDFLIVFPAFGVDTSAEIQGAETEGRHFLVRNSVSGTGLPVGDVPTYFGSRQRLCGFIDEYALVPGDGQDLSAALVTVAHEIAHQWSGGARFLDRRTGRVSDALLGLDGGHWSYFLSSEASVLYGANWVASDGGTYTATETMKRYSALDLYLMGLLAPTELGPFTLLQPSASVTTPATSLSPSVGTRIPASPVVVTATDLIAAMGPRVPDSSQAQTSFRAAFVIVTPPGQVPTSDQLDFVESVRTAWANQFFFMTRGRAVMQTDLVERPPASVASSPAVQLGVDYLLARQTADGSWADEPGTVVRDTQAALEGLTQYVSSPTVQAAIANGASYTAALQPQDVDESARQYLALLAAYALPPSDGVPTSRDLTNANPDGGMGLVPGYGSTVIDTVLAALATPGGQPDLDAAIALLRSVERTDGGWGLLVGGPSDLASTSLVLQLLAQAPRSSENLVSVGAALSYVDRHRTSDGRYLEDDTQRDGTAEAILALSAWDHLSGSDASASVEALLAQQQSDGSWNGTIGDTSLAIRALRLLMLPNLRIAPEDVTLYAAKATAGEQGWVQVVVHNTGHADAQGVSVQASDSNGKVFGPPVVLSRVAAGQVATARLAVDTSDHGGSSQLFVVVDPGGSIDETRRDDDRTAVPFVVNTRPTLPDLYVAAGSLVVTPASVGRVGATIAVNAHVGNVGLTDVLSVSVALRSGTTLLTGTSVSLPAGGAQDVVLTGTLPAGASPVLTVIVDPGGQVTEDRKDNNSASTMIQLVPGVDLTTRLVSVTPSPVDPGREVTVSFGVANSGTSPATATPTSISFLDDAGQVLAIVQGPTVSVPSGGAVSGSAVWRVGTSRVVSARVDVPYPGDLNPADNSATGPVLLRGSALPNLAIDGAPTIDPSSPLEAKSAMVSAQVRNTGQVPAAVSAVELWLGDPQSGGQRASRVSLPAMDGGAETTIVLPLPSVPATSTVLVVKVDPDDVVQEFDETDNTAVLTVHPLTIPDLAVTDGDIRPSNLYPRQGDHVSVAVDVANLGGQDAASATVQLFQGAPEAGGSLVGTAKLASVPDNGRATTHFEWDTTGLSGAVSLVAIVNADHAVTESHYDNDRASRQLMIQSGTVALSEPYFSPNGDGVKDDTVVYYQLQASSTATATIADHLGRVARTLGSAGTSPTGSLIWDGLDDRGRVVRDGAYHIIVATGDGVPVGAVDAVVDTNRSGVLDVSSDLLVPVALEDGARRVMHPGAWPYRITPVGATPDEQGLIVHYADMGFWGWDYIYKDCGFFQMPVDGEDPVRLSPTGWSSDYSGNMVGDCNIADPKLTLDGRSVVYYSSPPEGLWGWTTRSLRRFDLATRAIQVLADDVGTNFPLTLTPDGKAVIFGDSWTLESIAIDGSSRRLIASNLRGGTAPSPDASMVASSATLDSGGLSDLRISNLDGTGERVLVTPRRAPVCLQQDQVQGPEGPVERCVRYGPDRTPLPAGALVLPEGVGVSRFAWVSSEKIAYEANGSWVLDLASGEVQQLLGSNPTDCLALNLASMWGPVSPVADPAGENLVFAEQCILPQVWKAGLNGDPAELVYDLSNINVSSVSSLAFSHEGTFLYAAVDDLAIPAQEQHGFGGYHRVISHVGNLAGRLTGFHRPDSASIVFEGTADDLNFESWELSARKANGGSTAIPVARGAHPVVNGDFAQWTPPEAGTWEGELTIADKAGNRRVVSSFVSWSKVPVIENVRAQPPFFSPNGDGQLDTETITFSVHEPISTELMVENHAGAVVRTIPVTVQQRGNASVTWDGVTDQGAVALDGHYSVTIGDQHQEFVLDDTPPRVALLAGAGAGGGNETRAYGKGFYASFPAVLFDRGASCSRTSSVPFTAIQSTIFGGLYPSAIELVALMEGNDELTARNWKTRFSSEGHVPVVATFVNASAKDDNLSTWAIEGLGADGLYRALVRGDTPETPSRLPVRSFPGSSLRLRAVDDAANRAMTSPQDVPERAFVTAWGPGQFVDDCVGSVEVGDASVGDLEVPAALPYLAPTVAMSEFIFEVGVPYEPAYYAFMVEHTVRQPVVAAAVAYTLREGDAWIVDQVNVRWNANGLVTWDGRSAPRTIHDLEVRLYDVSGRAFSAPMKVIPLGSGRSAVTAKCALPLAVATVETDGLASDPEVPFFLRNESTGELTPLQMTLLSEALRSVPNASGNMDAWADKTYRPTTDLRELPDCSYSIVVPAGALHSASGANDFSVLGPFNTCRIETAHHEQQGDKWVLSLRETYKQPVSHVDLYWVDPCTRCRGLSNRTSTDPTCDQICRDNPGGPVFAQSVAGFDGLSQPVLVDVPREWDSFCAAHPGLTDRKTLLAEVTLADGSHDRGWVFEGQPPSPEDVNLRNQCVSATLDLFCTPVVTEAQAHLGVSYVPPPLCSGVPADYRVTGTATQSAGFPAVTGLELQAAQDGSRRVNIHTAPFAPGDDVVGSATIVSSQFSEGRWTVSGTFVRQDGSILGTADTPVFVVERSAPFLALTSPAADDVVCPVDFQDESGGHHRIVPVNGTAYDRWGVDHSFVVRCGTGAFAAYGAVPGPGALGGLDVTGWPSGNCEIRLEGRNAGHGSYCTNAVPFHLVNEASVGARLAPWLFSPNGDGIEDTTSVVLSVLEPSQLTVTATDSAGRSATIWQGPVPVGTTTIPWDGVIGGSPAVDGNVTLRLNAADTCSTTASATVTAVVDTTPPVVRIDGPADGSRIGGVVMVSGEASDPNFDHFELAIGSGTHPLGFQTIVSSTDPAAGFLGAIPASGLVPGLYTIRLSAWDAVGNTASAMVQVQVSPKQVINLLSASPVLISPNGDGILDRTTIRYQLLAAADATLEIVDPSGVVVSTVLGSFPAPAGDFELPLTLSALSGVVDGDYRVRLLVSTPGLAEEETAPLTLDRAPPNLALQSPSRGAVEPGVVDVAGSIDDPHLTSWSLRVVAPGGAQQVLASGRGRSSGRLAVLRNPPEGDYRLLLDADDGAGNTAHVETPFSSDVTAPVVDITTPNENAYVNGVQAPLHVLASAQDAHLASVLLEASSDGASWHPIYTGSVIGNDGVLWDVASEPDGPLQLRLTATDAAGNQGEATRSVIVDNTPPVAAITAPRNAYVKAGDAFTGTATDANVSAWTLELTSGPPSSTSVWVPLTTGTSAVDGVLSALASLPVDGDYGLRLTVTDLAGNSSSDTAAFVVDTTPPRPPTNLVATVTGGTVVLTWSASPDPDVVAYQVLRAVGPTGFAPVGSPGSSLTYTDAAVADGSYRYEVVALDGAGLQSVPSASVAVSINQTPPIASISSPGPGAAVSGQVQIRGSAWSSDDFKEYRLSVGAGAAPASFMLVARSRLPVRGGSLGRIDTTSWADRSVLTVRLEAEDLAGNVGEARTTLVVDGTPPSAPVLLSTAPSGSGIALSWSSGGESDLAGFIVYRNGSIANAPQGASTADLASYLLPPSATAYVDASLGDGTYTYEVQAFDRAGNGSAPSNSLTATLETRAPHATISSPAQLARLAAPIQVVARVADEDVASLQFMVRDGGGTWQPLGQSLPAAPYVVRLDPSAYSGDVLELKAVATDASGHADADPDSVFVLHAAPPTPPVVTTQVVQDQVHLSWTDPNAPGSVSGYLATRDGSPLVAAPAAPRGTAGASDASTAPRLAADGIGTSAWVSQRTGPQWWQLDLAGPVVANQVDLSLWRASQIKVSVHVRGVWVPVHSALDSGSVSIPLDPGIEITGARVDFLTAPSGSVGLYELTIYPMPLISGPPLQDGPLAAGAHAYAVAAVTPFGLEASATTTAVIYAPTLDPPVSVASSSPVALAGSQAAPGSTVAIQTAGLEVAETTAGADGKFSVQVPLIDGENSFVAVATDASGNVSLPSAPVSVTYDASPQAQLSLALAGVNGASLSLSYAVTGDASRIAGFHLQRGGTGGTTLAQTLPAADRAAVDGPVPNGTYVYTLTAFNSHGVEGPPSNPVAATVGIPLASAPSGLVVSPVATGGALRLAWSYSGPMIEGYAVERARSASGPFTVVSGSSPVQGTSYVDRGLTNGVTYTYRVHALDSAGNAGPPSGPVSGVPQASLAPEQPRIVAPTVPAAPIDVNASMTAVSGLAGPGDVVELRRDGLWLNAVQAGPLQLTSSVAGSANQSAGFGVSRDGLTFALGYADGGPEWLQLDGPSSSATVFDPALGQFGRVAFSPDMAWVAFEAVSQDDGQQHVFITSIFGGTVQRVAPAGAGEGRPVWSPDSSRLAYEARRTGTVDQVVGVCHVGSMTETILQEPGVDLVSPAWRADGTVLAIGRESDGTGDVLGFNADGGVEPALFSARAALSDLVVSPRGDFAAFVLADANQDMMLLELATGAASRLTSDSSQDRLPVFAKGGRELAWVRDADLVSEDLASLTLADLGAVAGADRLVGTDWGPVGFTNGGDAVQYDWGGPFTFDHVQLHTGENVFTATATDAGGSRSPTSEPISVTLNLGALADLAVEPAVQPPIPLTGETTNALVTVRNIGGVSSPTTTLQVSVLTSDGTRRAVAPVSIAALPAGSSVAAAVPIELTGLLGTQKLVVVVDPDELVSDGDRSNNVATLAFQVVATRDLALEVVATPTSVAVNGTITAVVTVQNPGQPVDATLATRLADPSGAVVVEASPAVYHPLAGGATTFHVSLPAGTALAGDYQVVAVLTPAGRSQVMAAVPVTIQAEVAATLAVSADRFRYAAAAEVSLGSLVTNTSRNAPLTGATHHLEIRDAAGLEAWTGALAAIPAVWMGGTTAVSTRLSAATLGGGEFVAHAWIECQGVTLAEAMTPFVVEASPVLVGTLAVAGPGEPPVVPAGSAANVTIAFQDVGTAASPATTGRLVLLAPRTGETLGSQDVAVPALASGASATQLLAVPTAGLRLDTYGLALVADVQGTATTLATARFRVADAAPPVLALQSPAQGAVVPGVVYPWIRAYDGDTGVQLVRAAIGGAVTPLALTDGNAFDGTWSGGLTLGPDGTYVIAFTAVDGEGNDGLTSPTASDPIPLTVVSDRTPPVLSVTGVTDGALVNSPVTLSVTATDLHLARVSAELDGVAYQPGTPYAVEGTHVLRAFAVDLAGNAATDVRVFALDLTPPEVSFSGVVDGQYLSAPATPVVVVTDASPLTYAALLDGSPWAGGSIGAEGRHVLGVDARDAAGNARHAEVEFWVDLTPPALHIAGVEGGVCYARPVTPVVTATDANLGAVTPTLDGQPFRSGTMVAQDGAHMLAATARDLAGHETAAQVSFTVDATPPAITMPEVDGRYFAAPVTLAYSVTDATATAVDATLDGAPFVSGGQVSAEGRHALAISAQDCAGNRSTRTATFVVDRTPPTLVLSGVIDGSVVAGPVAVIGDADDANLATVALELDAAPYVAGTPITAHGAHVVTGVATDLAGNTAHASLGFTIDSAAPRIAVDGVADGDLLGRAVTPIVTVTDDDLAGWEMAVDGVVLLPGATITAEGPHQLVVTAHDLAGNQARLALAFTIDLTPPAIDVGGVAGGMCYAHDVTPTYGARDANLASVEGRLDGNAFASGTVVGAEGDHSLVVTARDRAEHAVTSTTGFVVDKTAPTVTIPNLDGRYFAGPVTPSYTVSDPHLATTTVTLDGAPLAPGASVSAEGAHTLAVTAQDCAGNSRTQSASFIIDVTPPALALSGVAEKAVVKSPVRVSYTVSHETPTTVVLTLDGGAYTPGAAITAQGAHTVAAVATDAAGNISRVTRSFTIDDTLPVIQLAGVSDGELTSHDVVPVITVIDANPAGWTATVDGVELPPGGAISTEGTHALLVVAHDQAGNEANATVSFEIDRTPPVVSASVTDGVEYAPPLAVIYSATDAHLGPVTATLDGQPFASGGSVTVAGSHTLVVTADDRAGNEAVRSYSFGITGQGPKYHVEKKLMLGDLRVLARVACGKVGDASAAFLARALPAAQLEVVRNDSDLLVALRSGAYDLVVITDQVSGAVASASIASSSATSRSAASGEAVAVTGAMVSCGQACSPTLPVPPLSSSELARRLPAELTEAIHRGIGLLVFRTSTPAEPWLREALGLQLLGNEGSTTVSVLQTAVSGAMQLKVADGVALKLDSARSIGTFKRDGKVAVAIHGHGLGEVVVFGFDPARASGQSEALVAGAAAFAFTQADPAAGGVVAVRIEVKDEGAAATTRVREHLDPGLVVLEVRNGGVKLPSGDLEWTLSQGAGQVDALEYLLQLPELAGTYQTTAEVAQMVAGQPQVVGTHPLVITLRAGAQQLQAQAEQLAAAISGQGCDKNDRKAILADLALVRAIAGRTASDREAAIAALLDAVDHAKALQGVDGTPLRLALDSLLALWEGRQ